MCDILTTQKWAQVLKPNKLSRSSVFAFGLHCIYVLRAVHANLSTERFGSSLGAGSP
jgi:hypothetical protein